MTAAKHRVVLVVGASSGIGRATAQALARRGDTVIVAARSADTLALVVQECLALAPRPRSPRPGEPALLAEPAVLTEPRVLAVPTDVTERDAVERMFQTVYARYGRLDAVVNSAAVVAYGRFEDVPGEVFDQVVAINLVGTANVARTALRRFKADGAGHLVVVGSLLGRIATPWMSPYVTTKWAVHGLARTLQVEARSTPGVQVSLVSPGGVNTPIYAQAANYAGRVGRPPPPVDRPETVARAIIKVLDRPRRESSVGLANGAWTAGFRFLPGVYDVLVRPGMSLLGLSRTRVGPHRGNLFAPVASAEAMHGRWGRHWLRGAGPAAAAIAALGARRLLHRRAR